MEDIVLVNESLENKDNFRKIIEKYEEPLKRYIRRLLYLSLNDVDDIVQDAFINIYRNLNEYDSTYKFSSWIYRIAHNVAISFLRKNRKHIGLSLSSDEMEKIGGIDNQLCDCNKEDLNKALEKLDDKYKEVIILRYFEDKSYQEISDILKISSGTVGSLINRGIDKLKKILK